MRKTIHCLAIAAALSIAMPGSGFAQGKIKIAIWEFENHAETSWWFHSDMGPAARNTIDTEFSENKMLSDKFSVVERDKLNLVMKEQGLAQSGAVDPASAAKVGKILGVKYIILGGIDKFNVDNTRAGLGRLGVGGNLLQSNATISLRVVSSSLLPCFAAKPSACGTTAIHGNIPYASCSMK